MLSREAVISGFRWVLGRDPENEAVIEAHRNLNSLNELRAVLLESEEFENYYKHELGVRTSLKFPPLPAHIPRVIFMHIPKTAGSSFHSIVAEQFDVSEVCPVRFNMLHSLSMAELMSYRMFSGHFDLASCRMIPGEARIFTFLREPVARLTSMYHYLRSHRDEVIERHQLTLCHLAKSLDPLAFFSEESVRSHPTINNGYLRILATSAGPRWEACGAIELSERNGAQFLGQAIENLETLDGVGITEHFTQSVRLLFDMLELSPPEQIPRLQSIADMHLHEAGFERTAKTPFCSKTLDAMADLVELDSAIYAHGLQLFGEKLANW